MSASSNNEPLFDTVTTSSGTTPVLKSTGSPTFTSAMPAQNGFTFGMPVTTATPVLKSTAGPTFTSTTPAQNGFTFGTPVTTSTATLGFFTTTSALESTTVAPTFTFNISTPTGFTFKTPVTTTDTKDSCSIAPTVASNTTGFSFGSVITTADMKDSCSIVPTVASNTTGFSFGKVITTTAMKDSCSFAPMVASNTTGFSFGSVITTTTATTRGSCTIASTVASNKTGFFFGSPANTTTAVATSTSTHAPIVASSKNGFNFASCNFGSVTDTKVPSNKNIGKLSENSMNKDISWELHGCDLPKEKYTVVESEQFTFANATWCLRFCNKYRFTDGMHLTIFRLCSRVPYHCLGCDISVMSNNEGICHNISKTVHFAGNNPDQKVVYIFPQYVLGTLTMQDIITQNCAITVLCRIHLIRKFIDASSQTKQPKPSSKLDTLSENFKNLLLYGRDHDLMLKVKDKEFRAHKDILRVRSPVLQSMLNLDMMEKNSGVVEIEDCDPAAFEQLLFYLYSGKVETLDESNMLGLYYITDKYNIDDLKKDCCEFIKKSLSSILVCDVIRLALNHSDTELLDFAKKYFINNVDQILHTIEWQAFLKENPTQANELFIKASKEWNNTKK